VTGPGKARPIARRGRSPLKRVEPQILISALPLLECVPARAKAGPGPGKLERIGMKETGNQGMLPCGRFPRVRWLRFRLFLRDPFGEGFVEKGSE
jgi:hypothetical protein